MDQYRNNNAAGGYAITKAASYLGYVVQAITINFAPMLFVTFMGELGLSVGQVSALIALTFTVQFTVDFLSVFLVRLISYRVLICTANLLAAVGLSLMAVLPSLMPPFAGLCLAILVYSTGSGFIEVVVSPIIESCPSKNKEAEMSFLHSFYCWGQMATVGLSTLFFALVGISFWRVLTFLWAAVPMLNFFLFLVCPMNMSEQTEKSKGIRYLFAKPDFLVIMLIILCSGASEIAVSQWASAYCETALGVSKTVGDIAGPMAFALCMGASRLGYSLLGHKVRLERFMLTSGLVCFIGYMVISLSPYAWMGLCGFGICGLAVGILWPGAFSLASKHIDGGGTMFALLSFSGDAGCMVGPFVAGILASGREGDIGYGISCASVFPVVLCIALVVLLLRLGANGRKNKKISE